MLFDPYAYAFFTSHRGRRGREGGGTINKHRTHPPLFFVKEGKRVDTEIEIVEDLVNHQRAVRTLKL
jgi:hypothetical protein